MNNKMLNGSSIDVTCLVQRISKSTLELRVRITWGMFYQCDLLLEENKLYLINSVHLYRIYWNTYNNGRKYATDSNDAIDK